MSRERALKVVLVLVGFLFLATVYPLVQLHEEETLQMMLSIYVTLGIFLLLASRNPSANRSLIAFTAWSSFAHAALMAVQAFRNLIPRGELLGVAAIVIIGVALIVLAPTKQSGELASAAGTQARILRKRRPRHSCPETSEGGIHKTPVISMFNIPYK